MNTQIKAQFQTYITCGGNLERIIQSDSVEAHYNGCLPVEDFPDKNLETTPTGYRITGTHSEVGEGFELVINTESNQWSFEWIES